MAVPLLAALEIGTTRTVVCVGEAGTDTGGRIRVTGVGTYQTTGVRKAQIMEVDHVKVGIEMAARQAEKAADVSILEVMLATSGGHIQTATNSGTVAIRSGDRKVTKEDIEEVNEIANAVPLDPDRQILHTISQRFTLDDQPGIANPLGMGCKMLSMNLLAIHGVKNRITNATSVAKLAHLDVVDVAFSGLCASLAVLTPEQKQNGVVVVDLGGGTTDYVVYSNSTVIAAGCIAVGGDHVTNDIALAFSIPLNRAEEVKRAEGCAWVETESGARRVTLAADIGFEERQISGIALQTVIHARMDEVFRLLRTRLDEAGVLPHLGAGLVLTGGGAYLRRLTDLGQRIFGLPCRIGQLVNVDGLEGVEQPASFATAAGLIEYGRLAYEGKGLLTPIKKFFKGMFRI